jgi:CHAD domain-containing protein
MNQLQPENFLTGYLDERLEALTIFLNNTLNFPAEEDVHQMRVEIKKLNALIRMLRFAVEEDLNTKEFGKTLNRIFRSAGKLREDLINNSLAAEYNLDLGTDYHKFIEKKAKKHGGKLNKKLKLFLGWEWDELQKKLTGIARKTNLNILRLSALQFFNAEFDTIEKLYPQKSDEKILHKIRMHLKASGYIISLLSGLNTGKDWEEFYVQLKTTESLIGSWHDRVVFRKFLQKIVQHNSDPIETEQISSVLKKLETDINEAVTVIYQQLSVTVENQMLLR